MGTIKGRNGVDLTEAEDIKGGRQSPPGPPELAEEPLVDQEEVSQSNSGCMHGQQPCWSRGQSPCLSSCSQSDRPLVELSVEPAGFSG